MTRRRILAVSLCVLMALSVLVSSGFLAHAALHPHVCTGEDCPVCHLIEGVERVLRGLAALILIFFGACFNLSAGSCLRISQDMILPFASNPINLMVRLND